MGTCALGSGIVTEPVADTGRHYSQRAGIGVEQIPGSLSAYERENRQKITERGEPMALECWVAGAAVGLLLLLFYSITVQWLPTLTWFARGRCRCRADRSR